VNLTVLRSQAEGERQHGGCAGSAQRLAGVWDGFTIPDLADVGGPVLLVDDVIDSGWTMTVGSRLLRRAGASAVLPFALAQRG